MRVQTAPSRSRLPLRGAIACSALCVLLPGAAGTANAQQSDVSRRSFTFFESRLEIAVLTDVPGVLRIVRGANGRVEVAARSEQGLAGFAMAGDSRARLHLTSVSGQHVEYLVTLPERVTVRVQLPGRYDWLSAAHGPAATFTWGEREPETIVLNAQPLVVPTLPDGFFLAYASYWAPATLDVTTPGVIGQLEVRFQGGEFRLASTRPLSVQAGVGERMELRSGDSLDIRIFIPPDLRNFQLRFAGIPVLEVRDGERRLLCGGATEMILPDRHIYAFLPQSVRCD